MQRPLGKIEFRCLECNELFPDEAKLKEHFHAINTVSDNVFVIILPANVKPGTWGAAKSFASSIDELKKNHPDKKFNFMPFEANPLESNSNYVAPMAVYSILAIVN